MSTPPPTETMPVAREIRTRTIFTQPRAITVARLIATPHATRDPRVAGAAFRASASSINSLAFYANEYVDNVTVSQVDNVTVSQ